MAPSIEEIIRKHAIKNAFDYGKADRGAVLSKVFAEMPDSKKDVKGVIAMVDKIVSEVNKLPKSKIATEVSSYSFPEKEQREGLPELQWVSQGVKVNTRFAPNPSGFLTIGHSKVIVLCDEYAKKYNGNFYVRFEDTDPKTKPPLLEAYDAIIDDVKWLGCRISKVFKQSERMPLYYSYADKLIGMKKAYVCTCDKETMQSNRKEGIACKCRDSDSSERWKKMLDGYKEGEAVLRLKTDLKHPNSSVRDWIMFRIIDAPHPIAHNKYRVWPLYNFASVIDDHEMGINLVIRGKEHEINSMKQEFLYDALSWEMPHFLEIGILKTPELSHKSEISDAIKEGRLEGWDDPRAPTIRGFRKRGIDPQAIRRYIIESGIGKSDSYLDVNKLEAFDRMIKAAES